MLRRHARLIPLLILLAGAGCARQPILDRVVPNDDGKWAETDLVSLFPFTESLQDTKVIDLGTESGNLHLLSGWSTKPPRGAALPSESVAYLRQRRGEITLQISQPAARRLILRCAAVQSRRPTIQVSLRLNSSVVGQIRVGQQMQEAEVELPLRVQRAGRNQLSMLATLPRPLRSRLARRRMVKEPALACDSIRIEGKGAASTIVDSEAGSPEVVVPPGGQLTYYVRSTRESRILVAGRSEDLSAWIKLSEQLEGSEGVEIYHGPLKREGIRLALLEGNGVIARLELKPESKAPVYLTRLLLQERGAEVGTRAGEESPMRPANIILYVVDTLRADHLGCYGGTKGISPHIDSLADESALFLDAQAQASWTRPAVGSLLTGLNPRHHGAVHPRAGLGRYVVTLAEVLSREGYATAGFVTNMNVSPRWGFDRGFEVYRYFQEREKRPKRYEPASAVHRTVKKWLADHPREPFLLYIHVSDVHAPYTPSERYAKRFERLDLRPASAPTDRPLLAVRKRTGQGRAQLAKWLASLYDAEIAEFDDELGRFVEWLRQNGTLDRTLFILVGDHGEEFHEHGGFSHGRTLYSEQLQVPFLVRFPQGLYAGARIPGVARQVDVLPTVLDYLGVEQLQGIDGASLLPLMTGGRNGHLRLAISHTRLGKRELAAITSEEWKVILTDMTRLRARRRPPVQVFDRSRDRTEGTELSLERPYLVAYVRQLLAAAGRPSVETVPVNHDLDHRTLQKLRALGYIGSN